MEASAIGMAQRPGLRAFWASLDRAQRLTLLMMILVVVGLHVIGFLTLIALVAPNHYRLGSAGRIHGRDRGDRLYARDCATPSTPITSRRSTTPRAS